MKDESLETSYSLLSRLNHQSAGGKAAWVTFVKRYLPLIYTWCFKYGLQRAEVEDVSQQVLKKLYSYFPKYRREKGRFRAWLKTVVSHALSDWYREEVTEKEKLKEYAALVSQEAENAMVELLEVERLREMLNLAREGAKDRCEAKVWEAYRMTEDDNKSAEEAASALGIRVASVYKYRLRVKKRLEEEMLRMRKEEEGE